MKIVETELPDVLIIEPTVFGDERGFFFESFNQRDFEAATGVGVDFVQDNHSRSAQNVLRGIHYQIENAQGKLIRVTEGEVLDVAVDLRRSSPNFGRHVAVVLSGQNKRQLWVPPGFGHGFLVRSASADFLYKVTDYRYAEHERSLLWNDPALAIDWGIANPLLSPKDAEGSSLITADLYD